VGVGVGEGWEAGAGGWAAGAGGGGRAAARTLRSRSWFDRANFGFDSSSMASLTLTIPTGSRIAAPARDADSCANCSSKAQPCFAMANHPPGAQTRPNHEAPSAERTARRPRRGLHAQAAARPDEQWEVWGSAVETVALVGAAALERARPSE